MAMLQKLRWCFNLEKQAGYYCMCLQYTKTVYTENKYVVLDESLVTESKISNIKLFVLFCCHCTGK